MIFTNEDIVAENKGSNFEIKVAKGLTVRVNGWNGNHKFLTKKFTVTEDNQRNIVDYLHEESAPHDMAPPDINYQIIWLYPISLDGAYEQDIIFEIASTHNNESISNAVLNDNKAVARNVGDRYELLVAVKGVQCTVTGWLHGIKFLYKKFVVSDDNERNIVDYLSDGVNSLGTGIVLPEFQKILIIPTDIGFNYAPTMRFEAKIHRLNQYINNTVITNSVLTFSENVTIFEGNIAKGTKITITGWNGNYQFFAKTITVTDDDVRNLVDYL